MSSTIIQCLTFITFMVSEKIPMLQFSTNPDTWPTKNVNLLPWTHIRVTWFILCMIFLLYVANIQHLNYSRQESKQGSRKHNLLLIFLTYLWPWIKIKVIKSTVKTSTPSIIMQSLKGLTLIASEKKATLKAFFKQENMPIISLEHVWKSKIMIYSSLTWRNQQLYKAAT